MFSFWRKSIWANQISVVIIIFFFSIKFPFILFVCWIYVYLFFMLWKKRKKKKFEREKKKLNFIIYIALLSLLFIDFISILFHLFTFKTSNNCFCSSIILLKISFSYAKLMCKSHLNHFSVWNHPVISVVTLLLILLSQNKLSFSLLIFGQFRSILLIL